MKINRTVERSVKILKLLSEEKKGLSIKNIIEIMKIPRTSAYDILETLVHLGMIEKTFEEENIYKIGLKTFQIGNGYYRNHEIFNIIKKPLQSLADNSHKTVFYAVEDSGKIIYISKHEPKKSIITTSGVGSSNPMYCTSLGKVMLAFFPKDKQNKLIEIQTFEKKTPYTLTKNELIKELEDIKKRGYSIDNREVEEHMLCIGAPIFDYQKNVIGSISISGLYNENKNIEEEAQALLKVSLEISKKLGY